MLETRYLLACLFVGRLVILSALVVTTHVNIVPGSGAVSHRDPAEIRRKAEEKGEPATISDYLSHP